MTLDRLRLYVIYLVIAVVAWLCYAPGLHGVFLFDDYANLPTLGATGPIDNYPAFCRYITSGIADPIGRPVALLSFLLDAHDWPASPYPFKRTNVILHLLNGLLLVQLLVTLGRLARYDPKLKMRIELAALLGGACWLLHPLFVSTTLYIVQREAMLPATFTLAGLLMWLRGRQGLLTGHPYSGLAWVIAGLVGCTVLAMLSKANGLLLPALALTIDCIWVRHGEPNPDGTYRLRCYRIALLVLAGIPSALLAMYLIHSGWMGIVHGISSNRPWTLWQRLLTEPRVLLDYLRLLWLPRPFTPGLFNDHFRASLSLFSPITTLSATMGLAAMAVGSVLLRYRSPAIAIAVLFYLVGQSLESSTLALELYFEHRNYLPAMLMFWPLCLWLCGLKPSITSTCQKTPHLVLIAINTSRRSDLVRSTIALLLLVILATMTHMRSSLWGNPTDQALVWAKLNPGSPRAQANAAQTEMGQGRPDLAVTRLRPMLAAVTNDPQITLNLLGAECLLGHIQPSTMESALNSLRTTRDPGSLLSNWFMRAIDQASTHTCPELDLSMVDKLLDAALDNSFLTHIPGRLQDLLSLKGRLALAQGNPGLALQFANQALDKQVRIDLALEQAAHLGATGHPEEGLAHLDHYAQVHSNEYRPKFGMPAIHALVLEHQHYWDNEQIRLQYTLQQDMRSKGPH